MARDHSAAAPVACTSVEDSVTIRQGADAHFAGEVAPIYRLRGPFAGTGTREEGRGAIPVRFSQSYPGAGVGSNHQWVSRLIGTANPKPECPAHPA